VSKVTALLAQYDVGKRRMLRRSLAGCGIHAPQHQFGEKARLLGPGELKADCRGAR
jgi:hypothetical protein